MVDSAKNTWLFQRNEQKMSALSTLLNKNKRLQSCEDFLTLFAMVKYNDVSVKRTKSIRKVEQLFVIVIYGTGVRGTTRRATYREMNEQ